MTLRNATLTAVAALTVALAGGAFAQDSNTTPETGSPAESAVTTPAPTPEPEAAPAATSETEAPGAEAGAAAEEPAAAEDAPADGQEQPAAEAEAPAEGTAAEEAPAEDQPAAKAPAEAEAPAAEQPAAEAEAPAEEAGAEEAPAEDQPTAEAPAEAEAPAAEQPAAEAEAPAEEAGAEEAPAEEQPAADAPAEAEAPAAEETDAGAEPEAEAPAEAAAAESEAHAEEAADASHASPHIEDISFSFEGPFGKYDQFQLQRGLQVYTEVCAACHGLRYVPIRTLGDPGGPGLPENQVRAYAESLSGVMDPETEEERPRLPTDHFPTVSGMGMGPDLSLMAKSRAGFHGPYGTGISQLFRGTGGPEYIHAILVDYDGEMKEEAGAVLYHNTAFAGGWIQMPQPLMDDQVTYEDGTPATVDQMARDVSAFLMWTAEPKMADRKQVGLVSVLFLIVLSALLYLTNKRLWWPVKHRDETH